MTCCFFFSSRRRHTRCYRDWSSDVCSSDLCIVAVGPRELLNRVVGQIHDRDWVCATAAVVPPVASLVPLWNEGSRELLVSQSATIRGVSGAERARHRQRLWQSTIQADAPKAKV